MVMEKKTSGVVKCLVSMSENNLMQMLDLVILNCG